MTKQEFNNLKIGDVLILKRKAYGPLVVTEEQMNSIEKDFIEVPQKVTVEATTTNNELVCAWFDKENTFHREILNIEDIEIKNQF
jgi:hypothetical protein